MTMMTTMKATFAASVSAEKDHNNNAPSTTSFFLERQLDDAIRIVDNMNELNEYLNKKKKDHGGMKTKNNDDEDDDEQEPPLDQITVTTSSSTTVDREDDENASDCSSVSCECEPQDLSPSCKLRSIFGSYWNKQGLQEAPFYRSSTTMRSSLPHLRIPPTTKSCPEKTDSCAQEPLPKEESPASPPPSSPPQRRRSIFASQCHAQSEQPSSVSVAAASPSSLLAMEPTTPCANQYTLLPGHALPSPVPLQEIRKTRSAHAILTHHKATPTKSVLRPSRYSSSGGSSSASALPPSSGSIQRSVSFNDQVAVALVPPSGSVLQEQWAADGWSTWFA